MLARSSVFRSESFKTFVQYLAVGLAFVPVGAVYAYIVVTRGESLPALLVLLAVGSIMAQLVWRRTELAVARWGVRITEETAAPTVFVLVGPVATAPVFRLAVFAIAVFTSRMGTARSMVVGEVDPPTVGHSQVLMFTAQ